MNDDKPIADGRRILFIEDEHFISELYARYLTKSGYQVEIIADGQAGLDAAQTNTYDIILLDLMLPTVTGIDILKSLRDPARTTIIKAKIIIVTNLEQDDSVRADIEKQADGYLVKAEITPHQLVDFLRNIT